MSKILWRVRIQDRYSNQDATFYARALCSDEAIAMAMELCLPYNNPRFVFDELKAFEAGRAVGISDYCTVDLLGEATYIQGVSDDVVEKVTGMRVIQYVRDKGAVLSGIKKLLVESGGE